MRWSPSSVLQAVTPHLPAELVGGGQLEPCRQIAAELRTAVDGFYFECRLDDDPRVDFLVLTGNRLGAAPQLEATLGPERAAGAWQRNLSLLRGWAGADAALEGAPAAWLEYDIDARFDARAPVASPSLCVESSYFSRFVADPTIDHESARRRAYGALRHLVSESRRARVEQVVSDCIAALPEGGSLVYVSEMLTREPSVTKLYVALSKARVCEFLRAIAWPGERSQVDDILRAPPRSSTFPSLNRSCHGWDSRFHSFIGVKCHALIRPGAGYRCPARQLGNARRWPVGPVRRL